MKSTFLEELLYNLEPGDWIAIQTLPSPFVPEPAVVAFARKMENEQWMVPFRQDTIDGDDLAHEIHVAYLNAVRIEDLLEA